MTRTHATFHADFPDDSVWNENEELLRPGGCVVATAIHNLLTDHSIRCTEVTQRDYYGWEFSFYVDEQPFLCVIQEYEAGQWLLICESRVPFWRRVLKSNAPNGETTGPATVHERIVHDSRFSQIRWYHREQFEKGDCEGDPNPQPTPGL